MKITASQQDSIQVRNTNPILLGCGTASLGNYNYKVTHWHIPERRPRRHFCKGL